MSKKQKYTCQTCQQEVKISDLPRHFEVHKYELDYQLGNIMGDNEMKKRLLEMENAPACLLCSKPTRMIKSEAPNILPLFRCDGCGFCISAKDSRSYRLLDEATCVSTLNDFQKAAISDLSAEYALIKSGWNPIPKCCNDECKKWINQKRKKKDRLSFCPAIISRRGFENQGSIKNFRIKCLNSKCKTKFRTTREDGWLRDINIDTQEILKIYYMLLKSEMKGKTIIEDAKISKNSFMKIQNRFRHILSLHNVNRDIKLRGEKIEWDESAICGQNYVTSFQGNKPSKDPGGSREIKLCQLVEKRGDGSTGYVKTYVTDSLIVEILNTLFLDGIDLKYAMTNKIQLRTDMLAQNSKTTNFNEYPFKFKYKVWNHSDKKNPYVDPNDPTNHTQTIEQMHRVAKEELPRRHKTIKNTRSALHVYEYKHNEKVKDTKDFAMKFADSAHRILERGKPSYTFRDPQFPAGVFETRIISGLKYCHLQNLCKKICKNKKTSWQTFLKKSETWAGKSERYKRNVDGAKVDVRVYVNFIDILALRDTLIGRCKSETKKSSTRKRAVYHFVIKYGKFGKLNLDDIIKESTCSCPATGVCKHIIGALWHAIDHTGSDDKSKKQKGRKRKFCQVLAEFEHPAKRTRTCLVRRYGEKFHSNLRLQQKKLVADKNAVKFQKELVYAGRTSCAKRSYLCSNDLFCTR